MALEIIVLIPILTGFGLLYWAEQSEDNILKLMFRLIFLPLVWLSIHLAFIDITILYASNADLILTLTELITYTTWVFFIVGAYILYKLLMQVKDWLAKKKSEREDELYG